MRSTKTFFRRVRDNQKGVTAIEYGLIAALVSVAAIAGFSSVGTSLQSKMTSIGTSIAGA